MHANLKFAKIVDLCNYASKSYPLNVRKYIYKLLLIVERKKIHLKYTLFRYCYSSCAGASFELIKLYCNKREKSAF